MKYAAGLLVAPLIAGCAAAWLATLAGCTGVALTSEGNATSKPPATRPPIRLSENDVLFHERVFRIGSRYWSGMCGYMIRGNYDSRQVPRPEWAISIDELMDRDTPVVRVRAVAFEVTSNGSEAPRKARSPITALTFAVEGEREPLTARIIGRPSEGNVVEAALETAPAQKLLEALYDAQSIEISVTYQDAATEVLEVRGWVDHRQFTGLNGYLHQCLERLDPVPAGVKELSYTLVSPGRAYGFGFESPNSNTAPWD